MAHANQRCRLPFRYALRAQLTLIASRCGKEVQLSSGLLGWGVKKARRWPENLTALAQTLFQLQRGEVPETLNLDAVRCQKPQAQTR